MPGSVGLFPMAMEEHVMEQYRPDRDATVWSDD
jgi:hypothetical protein